MTDPRGKTDLERAVERVRRNVDYAQRWGQVQPDMPPEESGARWASRYSARAAAAGADLAIAVEAAFGGSHGVLWPVTLGELNAALAAWVAAVSE